MNHCNCIFQCGTYVSLWTYPWTKYEFCISRELQKERASLLTPSRAFLGSWGQKLFCVPQSFDYKKEASFSLPDLPWVPTGRFKQLLIGKGSEGTQDKGETVIRNNRAPLGQGLVLKKEFIGPGLHLRPVCADRARPPLQWTLNSVLSACGNDKGRIMPPSGQRNLEEEKTDTNHPCLRTPSIRM